MLCTHHVCSCWSYESNPYLCFKFYVLCCMQCSTHCILSNVLAFLNITILPTFSFRRLCLFIFLCPFSTLSCWPTGCSWLWNIFPLIFIRFLSLFILRFYVSMHKSTHSTNHILIFILKHKWIWGKNVGEWLFSSCWYERTILRHFAPSCIL